jgi:hypothetical protein
MSTPAGSPVRTVPVRAGVAVGMTQQYIAGELSILLAQLQAVTPDETAARDVADLRREAESRPLAALPRVVVRALALDDGLCWQSLTRGDAAAFTLQARVGADLREFSVCAGLLADP